MGSPALFFSALVSFMCLDGLWLGLLMRNYYRGALGPIARLGPDGTMAPVWAAVLPVYVLLALGELWFVLPRIPSTSTSLVTAFGWGAAFGLVTYGVYDFTNWSTLRGYGPALALIDTAWGMLACGLVATLLRSLSR